MKVVLISPKIGLLCVCDGAGLNLWSEVTAKIASGTDNFLAIQFKFIHFPKRNLFRLCWNTLGEFSNKRDL